MSDVKRLLSEATPLPWVALIDDHQEQTMFLTGDPEHTQFDCIAASPAANVMLVEHAVNHLPDYLAAVEALRALTDFWDDPDAYPSKINRAEWNVRWDEARAALARLRDEVTA